MTETATINLNILVALACETKPLVDSLGLKKTNQNPFVTFQGEMKVEADKEMSHEQVSQANVNLIVAGIGEQNMAIACGWLAAQTRPEYSIWLNLGIAGHKTLEVGTAALIARSGSSDFEQKLHYPPLIAEWQAEVASLTTFNSVVDEYPEVDCVDMEAYAFFSAAKKFAEAEFIQAIKVISDNQTQSSTELTPAKISDLIANATPEINAFIQSLIKCKAAVMPASTIINFEDLPLAQIRFTQRQREIVTECANKFLNLGLDPIKHCQQATDAKLLIQSLQATLQTHSPRLS